MRADEKHQGNLDHFFRGGAATEQLAHAVALQLGLQAAVVAVIVCMVHERYVSHCRGGGLAVTT